MGETTRSFAGTPILRYPDTMFRLFRFMPTRWWSPKAWKTWGSYVHWRLETYGVYDPAGRIDKTVLQSLFKQFPSYYRWLGQIDKLRNRPANSHP